MDRVLDEYGNVVADGDMVICHRNMYVKAELTVGKVYDVISVSNGVINIFNDMNYTEEYVIDRFIKDFTSSRNRVIDGILE